MRTQRPRLSLLLLVASFFYLHSTATATSTNDDAISFVRTSCNTTLYPDVCFSSLSRYANAIQEDPAHLARVAISVALTNASQIASYINNITQKAYYNPTASSRAASALQDCFSNLDDAVDEIHDSLKQMFEIGQGGSGGVSWKFKISNVQTWLSAALTDEETCTDGLKEVPDDPVKTDVSDRVDKAKKITSNALALVNNYANKGTP